MLMKTRFLLLSILILLSGTCLKAQETRLSYRLMLLSHDENKALEPVSVLAKGRVQGIREAVQALGGHFKYSAGNIASVTVPAHLLEQLANDPSVDRLEEGRMQLKALNDQMLIKNRIDMVHNGISPLTKGYDGEGVIVGIIDTGMDFNHPDFKDSLGNTRFLWIWDHNLANGANTPPNYGYGQEFSRTDINGGLAANTFDYSGHGTHVGGIATSNGRSHAEYTGVASKADIISVALNFNLDDDTWLSSVADAVDYVFMKADSAGKPCVINISAGSYYGSHDGKDLQAQMIDNLITAKNGRAVSAACGNAGGYYMHLRQTVVNDTAFTWFTYPNAGIYIECWADTAAAKNMFLSIGADNFQPTFSDRGQLSWNKMSQNNGQLIKDTLKNANGDRLAIVTKYSQRIGGAYSQVYFIEPDSTTYLFRLMSKGTGSFDCWSFDMVSSGLPAPIVYPFISKYKMPDTDQTMCSSFQCSDKVITVGQYVNKNHYVDVNGNLQTFPTTEGELAQTSSWGPTRDGRIKPDITSTGEMTLSALRLGSVAWFVANQPYKLAQDSIHIRDGGTSSAAPVVAGLGALYFQKNPTANWSEYKQHVTVCAVQDGFTGNNLPDSHWGHGKLDGFAVMAGCAALGVNENLNTSTITVSPNPAHDLLNVQLPDHTKGPVHLTLFNAIGDRVLEKTIDGNADLDVKGLAKGIYVLHLSDGEQSLKVVIE